jgi:hypothetical protein
MQMCDRLAVRRAVLARLGGSVEAIQQVLHYCENPFALDKVPHVPVFPMTDEPHLAVWRAYAAQQGQDTLAYLQARLPQLCIPIGAGISKIPAYDEVMHWGKPFRAEAFGGTLTLAQPHQLHLVIHEHPAGALPVLLTCHRPDFETLDRALAFHNEPVAIAASVNAHTIAGFLNWERIHRSQALWTAQHGQAAVATWGQERQRIAATEKWRFYDRLILVCEHPYSDLSAQQLGLDMTEEQWLQTSTHLRLEHEFTHYATLRLYDAMRLNLFDELLCDWAGMTAALGRFEARLFLQFLGLEDWPRVRPEGRVHSYCQELDAAAFALQCHLMVHAAAGVEALSRQYYSKKERDLFLLALTRLTLELLASENKEAFFLRGCQEARQLLALSVS